MKKEDAVDGLERAGHVINDANHRAWNVALHPTEHGWASSILGIAAIPVVSAASVGHLISTAIVKQIKPSVFDQLSGKPRTDDRP